MVNDSVSEDGWVVCRVFKKKNYQKSADSPKGATSAMSVDSNMNHPHPHHHHQMPCPRNDGVLDQILLYMGRTCKLENESLTNISADRFLASNKNATVAGGDAVFHQNFMHLPRLQESPTNHNNTLSSLPLNDNVSPYKAYSSNNNCYDQSMEYDMLMETEHSTANRRSEEPKQVSRVNDWVALDRLVASQLNGAQDHEETSKQLSCGFGDIQNVMSFCTPQPADDEDDVIQLSYPYLRSGTSSTTRTSNLHNQNYSENDLWSFARSSSSPSSASDPLCHLSV